MEEKNCKYKLVCDGVDRLSNQDAKTILNLTYLQLTDVFQDEESNQRLLETFLSSGILKKIESVGLRDTSSDFSCEAWARQFFHLLSRRYDVAAALNQLVNLDDPNLKSYKEQIHRIFNTLNSPTFPTKLEVIKSPPRATGNYENAETVPMMERCDSFYESNSRLSKGRYSRQISRESQTSRYRSKRAGFSKAAVAIIILAIGCVSLLSVCILLFLGYRITKSDYTPFETPVQNPNKKSDVLNSEFVSQENISNHALNEIEDARRFLNGPNAQVKLQSNRPLMYYSNLIENTNQTQHADNATFFDGVLTELPINFELRIQKMCETQSRKNISLKIEFVDEFFKLRIQCQSEVFNMNILEKPTIKFFYDEILSKVSDVKHLEIVYSKQDETSNDNTKVAFNNVDLSSLETVSMLFTRPDYSCRELDTFLGDISDVKLTKFVIIGMHIKTRNKDFIESIIDNMTPHRTLLLKNVSLYSELNIKSHNTSYKQLHLHISNRDTPNIPNNAVIKLLKGASSVEDFMTNIPISDVALKELERLKIQTLNVVHKVNRGAETMTFSYLKELANLRKFVVSITGWHPGDKAAPYLVLEGFEYLPNDLKDLQVYADFPIVIKKIPQCWDYKKSALSFGNVFVSLRLCQTCIPVLGCLSG